MQLQDVAKIAKLTSSCKTVALVTAIVAVLVTGYLVYSYTTAKHSAVVATMRKDLAEANEKARELEAAGKQVTVEVVTKYIDRVKVVKQKGDTIIKEVPVYVTTEADQKCTLTQGFAAVHDAAAANQPITEVEDPNQDLGIPLSAATSVIAENYSICNQTKLQLEMLQEWVSTQHKLAKEKNNE